MKKILIIGPMPPPTGGMQTVMEQMMHLNMKNYESIQFNVSKNKIIKSNILFNSINFIYRCVKLFVYLLIFNPAIVHIHIAADKDVLQKSVFHKICKIMNKKIVLHTHGSRFKEWYKSLNDGQRVKIKELFNESSGVIVLSESWKEYYSSISNNKNIFVINNAIEDIDFKKYKRIYPKNEHIVLFLSSVCKRKGVYDLLKAIKNINNPKDTSKEISKVKFVFVGPYEDKEEFFKEVDRLGIKDRCIFVGEVLGKERFKYFASADIFVLPSYAEGLPVAILEAMSFGLPIISTTVGAIPEVVKRENGILIKPGDINALKNAILKLSASDSSLKNNSIPVSYNKNNKDKINKNYTQKIFKSKLVEAYDQI